MSLILSHPPAVHSSSHTMLVVRLKPKIFSFFFCFVVISVPLDGIAPRVVRTRAHSLSLSAAGCHRIASHLMSLGAMPYSWQLLLVGFCPRHYAKQVGKIMHWWQRAVGADDKGANIDLKRKLRRLRIRLRLFFRRFSLPSLKSLVVSKKRCDLP